MSLHMKEYQKIEQLQGKTKSEEYRAKVAAKKQEEEEQGVEQTAAGQRRTRGLHHGPDQGVHRPQGGRILNSSRKSDHTL